MLKQRLSDTLEQIDNGPGLGRLSEPNEGRPPDTDPAFQIWKATDLSRYRLTSAIELYGPRGRLASRFALRLPEPAPLNYSVAGCNWDFLDEVSPFGSSERHVLRASRGICGRDQRPVGALVVRVMLDYLSLPFISTESPYQSSLGSGRLSPG